MKNMTKKKEKCETTNIFIEIYKSMFYPCSLRIGIII